MKKIKAILGITLIGVILGAVWDMLQTRDVERWTQGAVHGAFIGFCLANFYVFQKNQLRDFYRKLPFWMPNFINAIAYILLIIIGRSLALTFYNGMPFSIFNTSGKYFFNSVIFAFVGILIFSLLNEIVFLIGRKEFQSLVTGEYLRAKKRRRIVLFLDMTGSTKIAEKIGDSAYTDLLNDFFFFMEKPLNDTRGRIYKYIGDEVIITWSCNAEQAESALRFHFEFKNLIEKNSPFFERNYGVVPTFKTGIHAGEVIIREIGESKKEIALIGDSLNTASRVLAIAKSEKKSLLVSGDFEELISNNSNQFQLRSVGKFELRGKEEEMELFEV